MRSLLVVTCLILAGCSEAPSDAGGDAIGPSEPPAEGCVRGVVVDDTITPLADVRIRVLSMDGEVVSDQVGVFEFCGLSPGTYFVEASKAAYETSQSSFEVREDGSTSVLRIQLTRIPGAVPYVESFQFDGFYECAFALAFITDSCDFAVRTAHDAGATPLPRNVQNNVNTAFYTFSPAIHTVIQETFWDDGATQTFRSSLQDTPIDNLCDCSTKHMEHKGEGGALFDRMDRDALGEKNTGGGQSWPQMDDLEDGQVAVRGFIPFQDGATDVDYAVNLQFQMFTSFFHHHVPDPAWTFVTKDQHPVPE